MRPFLPGSVKYKMTPQIELPYPRAPRTWCPWVEPMDFDVTSTGPHSVFLNDSCLGVYKTHL